MDEKNTRESNEDETDCEIENESNQTTRGKVNKIYLQLADNGWS